jgi:hypothetical protein
MEGIVKTDRGLRLLARVFWVLGWLVLAAGVLLACLQVTTPLMAKNDAVGNPLLVGVVATFGVLTGLSFVVGGVAFSLTLFFAAAVIDLLLDIKANSGDTRELLRRALTRPEPSPAKLDASAPGAAVPPGYKRP